jgi:sugar lactone lactonase YvrE
VTDDVELYAGGMPFPEGPAWGPDGLLYVCCRRHGWIARVDADRTVHRVTDTGGKPQALALSPEQDWLYLADAVRRQILTLDVDGRLRILIDDPQLIGPNDLTFGPLSGDLYFTDPGNEWGMYKGNVYRCFRKDKRLLRVAQNLGFPNGLAVTSDERQLLVAETLSDRLLCVDLDRLGEPTPAFQFEAGSVPDGMEWLSDGELAIAQHGLGHVSVIDVRRWTERRLPLLPGSHPTNLIHKHDHIYVTDDTAQGVQQRVV